MAQTKRGLGRGFESLLPSDFDKSLLLSSQDKVEQLPLNQLQPNPQQPRKHFDDSALQELAASIKRFGVVQPIVVTPQQGGKYTIIAGERRWRASQLAKQDTVPALIRSHQELEQLELALIENVQRVDLGPLEQAISIERLHQQFNQSYEDIAKRLGKGHSTVINIVRLLQLPSEARDALTQGLISEGHARALLSLKKDPERLLYLLKTIIEQGWNVRQAERFVTSVKAGHKDNKVVHQHVSTETPQTKELSRKLGTPVHVRRMAHGGKLEIEFKNDDELDRLLKLF